MSRFLLLVEDFGDPVELEKAILRRLQAALVPSLFPRSDKPSDKRILDTLADMTADDRVQLVLRRRRQDLLSAVVRRVKEVLASRTAGEATDSDIIEELWELLDEEDLNSRLATNELTEQPEELLVGVLQGPYRTMHS